MPQDPFAQNAWKRARDRFTEDLSESERSVYHQSSLEMIFYDASAAQKRHENSSVSRNVVSKLQPLTAAIEQYGEALDVFINAYPLALSPLWGSIRVCLLLAREFGKYFEKLVDMFERIGDVLPRFRAYERLFPNNERLVQSLSVVYVDILKFCSDVKTVFRRGKRSSVINIKIFSKLVWKPFDMQFGDRLSKFREHKRSVEKEAELSHMIESADSRALILANRLQLETEKREQDRSRMLSQLSAVSHQDLHDIHRQAHHPGTGSWVLETREYTDWVASHTSTGLCCCGIPGSGKSVLISTCIENLLQKESESGTMLIYYYCSYADPRSLLKPQILGNILKQLLLKGLLSEQVECEMLEAFVKTGRNLTDDVLTRYIFSAVERYQDLSIVLDGLDECDSSTTRSLLDVLSRLMECTADRTRVLLTCREESQVMESVKDWSKIRLCENVLADDMRSFIACSVRSKIDKGELRITEPALEIEVVDKLANKAHGMFLWIHFQLIDLCASLSPAQIRTTLDNLPDGLGNTYQRILMRISGVPVRAAFASRVFRWLACARRPLRIDELQEAVAFDGSDTWWDAEKIPDADLLLQSCQGLVVRDHSNATTRFAHHTVCQYLTCDERFKDTPVDEAHKFRFSRGDAELEAVETCVTYLSFSDFETAVVPKKSDLQFRKNGILGPGGPGSIPTTLGIGKPIVDVMYRILGGRAKAPAMEVDFARYLNIKREAEDSMTAEKYALKDYIVTYWLWHTDAACDKIFAYPGMDSPGFLSSTVFLPSVLRLIKEKILPFEIRPWGSNRHFGPYGCNSCWTDGNMVTRPVDLNMTSMIHWATEHGLCNLIRTLDVIHILGNHVSVTSQAHILHERYSNQTLLIACRFGEIETFKYLEKYQMSGSFTDFCLTASAHGHAKMLKYLLFDYEDRFGENFIRAPDENENDTSLLKQMLFKAATDGQDLVVEVISRGWEVYVWNMRDIIDRNRYEVPGYTPSNDSIMERDELSGLTPLHVASANGHTEVIHLLFKHFLHIDYGDANEITTALHLAVENGHYRAVEELVSQGASVYRHDNVGKTPLWTAARHGHLTIVTFLLARLSGKNAERNGMIQSETSSALEVAAEYGHANVVKKLLAVISPRSETIGSTMPLHLAAKNGHLAIVKLLVESRLYSVDQLSPAYLDGTTLEYLVELREYKMDQVIGRGIELTPLMCAAAYGHTEVVEYVAEYSDDLNQATEKGITAVGLAEAYGHAQTLEMLYEKGAQRAGQ